MDSSGYGYDLNGNIVRKYQPNGGVVGISYDALNRQRQTEGPQGSDAAPLYRYVTGYDVYGNVVRQAEQYPSTNAELADCVTTMEYDGANRLVKETRDRLPLDPVMVTYTYDAANNRISSYPVDWDRVENRALPNYGGISYEYNNLNQLIGFADYNTWYLSKTYAYDMNGNRIGCEAYDALADAYFTETYVYDGENRLIALTKEGATPSEDKTYRYAYDYRTRRVLRDESAAGGVRTMVAFSGGTSEREYVGSTISGTSSPTVEFIRGSDYGGGVGGILYSLRGEELGVKHYSARGDVIAQTDGSGSLTYQASYEGFGRHDGSWNVLQTAEWGQTDDRQRANTKDEDPTGLLNEGFRYRDLDTGAFLTRDPLGFVDGPNVYTYVVQNPWTKFDPEGLSWLGDVGSMYAGYWQAGKDTVGGLWHMARHPIDTVVGMANAVMHPVDTATAIADAASESWNSGYKGKGRVVGHVLIALATASTSSAKSGNLAKIGETSGTAERTTEASSAVRNASRLKEDVPPPKAESAIEGATQTNAAVKADVAATESAFGKTSTPKADFVVTPNGTVVPTSQSQMRQGFDAAGLPSWPTRTVGGSGYSMPDGTTIRLMPQSKNTGMRASFEKGTQQVTPDGEVVQPPRKMAPADRKQYIRERTHVEQQP